MCKANVDILLLTYNQGYASTIRTIASVVCQQGVSVRLIVADDGSEDNNFESIEEYLYRHNFKNYILLDASHNRGTVGNIYRALPYVESNFVKLISPGDCLYGTECLSQWLEWAKVNGAKVSFCDIIAYTKRDSRFQCSRIHAYPQDTRPFRKFSLKRSIKTQILYNDYWCGAATLVSKEYMNFYIDAIVNKIRYSEDNIYRLMATDGIERRYYPNLCVLYETSSGISSLSNEDICWHKTLYSEWQIISRYILEKMKENDDPMYEQFRYFVDWKSRSSLHGSVIHLSDFKKYFSELIPLYKNIPGYLCWHLRSKILERKTKYISKNYLNAYMNYLNNY